MKNLVLASVILLVSFVTASFAEQKQDVTFKSADGFQLKGTFYSAEKAGPGILMLHQCNADRQIYDRVATMLAMGGYNVLTFDFRGFGESKNSQYMDFAKQRDKIVPKMPDDVDAAFNFLSSQDLVNKTSMGVVGGSCGVNQAVQAARRHPEVKTLALLSGGTDENGEAFIKNSKIPVMGAASDEDTRAAASIKKIIGMSTNSDSQLEMFKDAGHAAFMFAKQPDLEADIVLWFRQKLPVSGYNIKPLLKK